MKLFTSYSSLEYSGSKNVAAKYVSKYVAATYNTYGYLGTCYGEGVYVQWTLLPSHQRVGSRSADSGHLFHARAYTRPNAHHTRSS